MRILHAYATRLPLPAKKYGGTERVIWSLAQAQMRQGHEVKFLARNAGELASQTLKYDRDKPVSEQITDWPDVVHFHWPYEGELDKPFLCTEHGNAGEARTYPQNTVFLSEKHASNHHASCYVYNGLDWRDYGEPHTGKPDNYFHFLGKARSALKNLDGAVRIAGNVNEKLAVLGGNRFNFGRNPYFDFHLHTRFKGMVGGEEKHRLIRRSKGLIFPVRWHEPFGLAITESLFLGTPVFSTPYGSLPELINNADVGFLSSSYKELEQAVAQADSFSRQACHEYARDVFNAEVMEQRYYTLYEEVINGHVLNNAQPHATGNVSEILPMTD